MSGNMIQLPLFNSWEERYYDCDTLLIWDKNREEPSLECDFTHLKDQRFEIYVRNGDWWGIFDIFSKTIFYEIPHCGDKIYTRVVDKFEFVEYYK